MRSTTFGALGRMEKDDDDPFWFGRVEVDGREVGVEVPASQHDAAAFERAARVIATLDHAVLERTKLAIGEQLLVDHQEWYATIAGATPAQTAVELAARLRLANIELDEDGVPTLWFKGEAFSDHAILATLPADGGAAIIERA